MTGPLDIGEFTETDEDAIVSLWRRADLIRPHNDPVRDLRFAQAGPSSTVLVGRLGPQIIGSVMVGHDGHRGTIYYLAIDPNHRHLGYGAQMLAAAEAWLVDHGVWKLNLLIRAKNRHVRKFYRQCGYEEEIRIVMSRRISKT